jgi:hypothetical protein
MPLCSTHPLRQTGLTLGAAFLITFVGAPLTLRAQQVNPRSLSSLAESAPLTPLLPVPELPDAPDAAQSGQTAPAPTKQTTTGLAVSAPAPQQTKRILGIYPNFSSVSADTKLPPQTVKEKFILAGKNSFDYSSFLIAGVQAGFAMNANSYPEFHQGVAGYGRYYWHTLLDTADENFMVSGVGPALFHQDNRYYTLGHGGFRKRAFYAVTRVLVTRQDDGDKNFNYSEVIGSGAAAGVSTLYYPTKYRTWTKVGQKWLTSDIIDGANFTFKEFWPDINKKIFHTH